MTDGPSANLNMDRRWKRAARSAENDASELSHICAEIETALVAQWREQVPPQLPAALTRLFDEHLQGQLFAKLDGDRIEAARRLTAGHALGDLLVDCCLQVAADGLAGPAALHAATVAALTTWAERHHSQIREHSCSVASASRASAIDKRLRDAFGACDLDRLVSERLTGTARAASKRPPKHSGIEEGPSLPS